MKARRSIHDSGFAVYAAELLAHIGVDSGCAGIWDKQCPKRDPDSLLEEGIFAGLGAIAWSGHGDGAYPVFAGRHQGKVAKLRLVFLGAAPEIDNLIAKAAASAAKPYSASTKFAVGDTLAHVKFGTGAVLRIGDGKIDVRFADATRTLIHAKVHAKVHAQIHTKVHAKKAAPELDGRCLRAQGAVAWGPSLPAQAQDAPPMNNPRMMSGFSRGFSWGLVCAALLLACSEAPLPPPGTPPAGTATKLSPMALPNVPPEQPAEPPARTVIVVSDLHFGLGKLSAAEWDHYEDFRWSAEWSDFLGRIDQEGSGATDLILNGDAFELWQSRTGDCQSRDPERGCSGEEALQRVQRIIAAHAPDLQRLGQFAMAGNNRVVIVPGNHDAALLFPEVAAAVMQSTGAAPTRLAVSTTGYWISGDRRIYADHGHQIGIDPNAYRSWPRPFREQDGKWYLTRPWGEQFMQSFYNAYEDRYPIIDNVSAESEAVKFALAREGQSGLLHAVGRFVGFTLLKTSWTQRIDLARLQSPSAPNPSSSAQTTPTAEELAKDPQSREKIFGGYLSRVLDGLPQQLASSAFDLYVFSHTHNLDVGFEIPSKSPSGTTRIVNSGAWQRVVSSDWLKREQARRQIPVRDVLVAIGLEDLPPCYGVVRIRPYAPSERPRPEVLYFRAASSPSAGAGVASTFSSTFSSTCE